MPKLRMARIRPAVFVSMRSRRELLGRPPAVRRHQLAHRVRPRERVRIGIDAEPRERLEVGAPLLDLIGFFGLIVGHDSIAMKSAMLS